ncbi:filamin-A-like [Antedon mediterranea]|uniref:filamin-A-like n=1 Tax=Antedon mediterranea TaxID=105859 RepID=UPI003AF76D32
MSEDPGPDTEWTQLQQNVVIRWCNKQLEGSGKRVKSIGKDFSNGVILITLVEKVTNRKIPRYNKMALFKSKKIENVQVALELVRSEGLKLIGFDAGEIVNGNVSQIGGVIWSLILKYAFLKLEDITEQESTRNQQLLNWVKDKIEKPTINNLTTDWNDGCAVHALVDAHAPGLCPKLKDDNENSEVVEHLRKIMQLADDWLGVTQVLTPEELTDSKIDELSMMTYLSGFLGAKLKEGAPIETK